MIRNRYNLYEHGKLIKENQTCAEISAISKIKRADVSTYGRSEQLFNGTYRVTISQKIETEKKQHIIQTTREVPIWWTRDHTARWNRMRDAAEIIKGNRKVAV